MTATSRRRTQVLLGGLGVLCLALGLSIASAACATDDLDEDTKSAVSDGPKRLDVAEARERARLMHSIYASTLESMHHHFFRRERATLPARALEDVFADLDRLTGIKAAWISVNTKAMSINHEPKSDFEKNAAKAIASGKEDFEVVEDGYYRRAGAIPLGAGCVSCHTGFFSRTPQTERFAGLVISVPIKK